MYWHFSLFLLFFVLGRMLVVVSNPLCPVRFSYCCIVFTFAFLFRIKLSVSVSVIMSWRVINGWPKLDSIASKMTFEFPAFSWRSFCRNHCDCIEPRLSNLWDGQDMEPCIILLCSFHGQELAPCRRHSWLVYMYTILFTVWQWQVTWLWSWLTILSVVSV